MIYISVDNDHHANLALQIIDKFDLPKSEIIFISHRSKRNEFIPKSSFKKIEVSGHPLSNGHSYRNPLSYLYSVIHQVRLRKLFNFSKTDTLIVLTEYQLNNSIFSRQMTNVGGSVYLFDEGIAFYFNNSHFHKTRVSGSDAVLLALYNFALTVMGIPSIAKKGFEDRMYVQIKERYISRIYSRINLPTTRDHSVWGYRNVLVEQYARRPKDTDTAIFFATNLSTYGLGVQERRLAEKALRRMSSVFKNVYLKVHPSDYVEFNEVFEFYRSLAAQVSNIELIDNSITGNQAIEKFNPAVVVGTIGASLFDAFLYGCQPIFLFSLLPEVHEFEICRYTLDQLNYRYIDDLSEIKSTYDSAVDCSRLSHFEDTGWHFSCLPRSVA
jgi:hypothetical protein